MKEFRKIDLEAHFFTKEYVDILIDNKKYPKIIKDQKTNVYWIWFADDACTTHGAIFLNKLLDLEDLRPRAMDKVNIDMQILSLSMPGVEQLDSSAGIAIARKTNDYLSEIIQRHPHRFSGFATLPIQDPGEAADELERAVKDLGLVGWKTHSNYGEYGYLDDKRYWPILEKAARLNVPVYIHPTVPAIPQLRAYGFALAGPPFGFGVETGMCAMRLILSGVFDKYPKLKIILGHLGEALPFLMKRMDKLYVSPVKIEAQEIAPKLSKKPSDYIRSNFYFTTSGNFYKPTFECTSKAMGIDRVLFATDYPFEDLNECVKFIDGLHLAPEDERKIYYENAIKLFKRLRTLL